MSSAPVILEILSDRLSEKGVFVAAQMLDTLHGTLDAHRHFWQRDTTPDFTYEIASVGGSIRFLVIVAPYLEDLVTSQIYAHYPSAEVIRTTEYLWKSPAIMQSRCHLQTGDIAPIKVYTDFKDRSEKEAIDPYSSLTSALTKVDRHTTAIIRVTFRAESDHNWKSESLLSLWWSRVPLALKRLLARRWVQRFSWLLWPLLLPLKLLSLIVGSSDEPSYRKKGGHEKEADWLSKKLTSFGFRTDVSLIALSASDASAQTTIASMARSMSIFSFPGENSFHIERSKKVTLENLILRTPQYHTWILTSPELAGLVHLPTMYVKTPGIAWTTYRRFEPPHNLPPAEDGDLATPLGETDFRWEHRTFGILPIDRARHTYIIGKTGMGKSTLLENMIWDDISRGRGVAVVDPHGDLAETVLSMVPKSRTNDLVVFDPTDTDFPIAFNMLENVHADLQPLVASGLVGIFKRIFGESWGPRLEYILRNTVLTLLQVPDSTLISVPLLLTQKSYRLKVVSKLKDSLLRKFWESEFDVMSPSQMTEAVSPILNKVGQFLSSHLMRNVLGQPRNPFSLRWAMDNSKIVVVNLSKGKLGEDASGLLGSMIVTKFQIDAMSRADMSEKDRKDFYLYVDEFQNFATDSFATILSEARKYRLSLIMANQYIAQMSEAVQGAVFGNVWSTVAFQVGPQDAPILVEAFGGEDVVTAQDFMNLAKYHTYTKLLVEGMPTPVFSTRTLSPVRSRISFTEQKSDVLRKVSREKYAKPRAFVEKKIDEYASGILEVEKKFQEEGKKRVQEAKDRKAQEKAKES